ncbi:unnamed protein product, partial [Porites evermanni]
FFKENVLSADEDRPSYIPPVEFGRKREINRRLLEKLRDHRHQ